MPATVKKTGDVWRVVEADTGQLVKRSGTAVDGGGHDSKAGAEAQARAINASQHGSKKK